MSDIVNVIVTDTLSGKKLATKVILRSAAINFTAIWNVQHAESDCSIHYEEVRKDAQSIRAISSITE